jgi:hypothetical protein
MIPHSGTVNGFTTIWPPESPLGRTPFLNALTGSPLVADAVDQYARRYHVLTAEPE